MNKKGEPRKGGMPVGWKKPEGVRTQHQLRAYDDEWEILKAFDKILKYGNKQAAINFVEQFKIKK